MLSAVVIISTLRFKFYFEYKLWGIYQFLVQLLLYLELLEESAKDC